MKARRGHRGDQTRDDVCWLQDERARGVAPHLLEAQLELAVSTTLEAVLRDGRAVGAQDALDARRRARCNLRNVRLGGWVELTKFERGSWVASLVQQTDTEPEKRLP